MRKSLVVSVRSLCKTYKVGLRGCTATARALEDIHLDVASGEIVAVVGPANAGKTTLLRCVAGLLTPDAGAIACHRTAGADDITTRYVRDPIELSRLQGADESWDVALVDNVDVVRGDVGCAFALLAAARSASTTGRAMMLATRDIRLVARIASRIVLMERGRIVPPVINSAISAAARVAETSVAR